MGSLVQIGNSSSSGESLEKLQRLPQWLRRSPGSSSETVELKRLLRRAKLNTVCEDARCPNIAECFSQKTATFMILGDVCTRGCRFCSIITGKPHLAETEFCQEAFEVANAAKSLGLKHVVVTSVARDDLADGGASGFVATIQALREQLPLSTVEVLIPDLRGKRDSLAKIVEARPDVINHNIETVPRLYRKVRPGSSYLRSLELLRNVKEMDAGISTKTGVMLGLGETPEELKQVFIDSHDYGIDIFTAGQYMRPSRNHLPVQRYIPPNEFEHLQKQAEEIGFSAVFMGPLVRSSYHAGEVYSVTNNVEPIVS